MIDELQQRIASRADDAVARFQEPAEGRLDFSAASMAIVDELVVEIGEFASDLAEEQFEGLVQDLGCYLFETARRILGGKYYWMQEIDQPVLSVGGPGFSIAMAGFPPIRRRLRGEAAEPLSAFFDGFAERVRTAQPGEDVLCV